MSKVAGKVKKVISQNELRRIMSEQKKKISQNVKKIDSPLAKYSDSGELRCILCDAPVRSEALWGAHLASKEHLANITAAKRARAKPEPPAPTTFKRPAPSPLPLPPEPAKKPKGILKNASTSKDIPADFFDSSIVKTEPGVRIKTEVKSEVKVKTESRLLSLGQYDSDGDDEDIKPNVPIGRLKLQPPKGEKEQEEPEEEKPEKGDAQNPSESLPEGFFDDPKLDAKVRNVEYRDPVEEEWEKFQRAIKEEAEQSQQIIQEEQEEATAERQLEEIDEQMRNWSRVLELERRKEQVHHVEAEMADSDSDQMDDSEEGENFDEFLDWRSKQS